MDEICLDALQRERIGRLKAEYELARVQSELAVRRAHQAEEALGAAVSIVVVAAGASGEVTMDLTAGVLRVHTNQGAADGGH